MPSFKRILFPVEFTPQCKLAGQYVAAFARHFNAEVTLLHCEALPVEPERLEQFLVEEFEGLKVERCIRTGDPATEIIRFANNERVDLIMMPTHGRPPFRKFILGSVTTKVLHDAACPVWTSAHLERERPPVPPNLSNILCAVDLDDTGLHTIRYAANFAGSIGAKLTIAHAVPVMDPGPESYYMDAEIRADLIGNARGRLVEMQALAGANAMVCVGTGNIARFVNHAAQSHNAGLVIISRGGNGLLGRLRTHDYGIIRECESPVLSI